RPAGTRCLPGAAPAAHRSGRRRSASASRARAATASCFSPNAGPFAGVATAGPDTPGPRPPARVTAHSSRQRRRFPPFAPPTPGLGALRPVATRARRAFRPADTTPATVSRPPPPTRGCFCAILACVQAIDTAAITTPAETTAGTPVPAATATATTTTTPDTDLANDLYALIVFLHKNCNSDLFEAVGVLELTLTQIKLLHHLEDQQ